MSVEQLIEVIKNDPSNIAFENVISVIEANYHYTPTSFKNGDLENQASTNEGSCKIFAFAQLNDLSKAETLACFGRYYRDDVLGNPNGNDHGNIRNFINSGWNGISFSSQALQQK